ncbi:MAG: hypothetical protein H6816_02020 [Phycisphaerales bacterium]|nr:hypothetical protein [Phycisphaerales bacterium]
MKPTAHDIINWQNGLTQEFSNFGRVDLLEAAELDHAQQIRTRGYGFGLLMRSYQEFALQTIDEASKHGHVLNIYNVGLNVAAFRRLRTCLLTFGPGYYFDAGSALRTVLNDRARFVGASLSLMPQPA